MRHHGHELYPHYASLWQAACPAVRQGQIACDPHLLQKALDGRRGMTVIARLAPEVVQRIGEFLEAIRAIEPRQYYYPLADIHITVLSLFTATEQPQPYLARVEEYITAVSDALVSAPAFTLDTIGITLSSGAVLTQGFPQDTTLTQIRDRLRARLTAQGLGGGLDQRYRLRTAHNTVIRFAAPLQAANRFVDALQDYREYVFGMSVITRLDLVMNDWYMSSERLNFVKTYYLGEESVPTCRPR